MLASRCRPVGSCSLAAAMQRIKGPRVGTRASLPVFASSKKVPAGSAAHTR